MKLDYAKFNKSKGASPKIRVGVVCLLWIE